MSIVLRQEIRELESDLETPISLFLKTAGADSGILLESVDQDGKWGRFSLVAHDILLCLASRNGTLDLEYADPLFNPLEQFRGASYEAGLARCMALLSVIRDTSAPHLPPISRALYGAAAASFGKTSGAQKACSGSVFLLPRTVYLFDHLYNRLTEATLNGPQGASLCLLPPALPCTDRLRLLAAPQPSDTVGSFRNRVEMVKSALEQSQAVKVTLSLRYTAPCEGDLFDAYRQLRRQIPSAYMFFMRHREMALAVSSPEVLVTSTASELRLCSLTGSKPRGNSVTEDNCFEEELVTDPLEQMLHGAHVDFGRNDLCKVSIPGTVAVESFMDVERFAHGMHLGSRLRGLLQNGKNAVDVALACFPSPSQVGVPKHCATQMLERLEPLQRDMLGGAIGWLGLDKDSVSLDLGVVSRSLCLSGNTLFWQAGTAVTAWSDSDSAWQECVDKCAMVAQVLDDIGCRKTQTV